MISLFSTLSADSSRLFRCTALFLCVLPLFAWSCSSVRSFYQFREFAFSRAHSAFTISRVKTLLRFHCFPARCYSVCWFQCLAFLRALSSFPVLLPLRYLTNCDLIWNNLGRPLNWFHGPISSRFRFTILFSLRSPPIFMFHFSLQSLIADSTKSWSFCCTFSVLSVDSLFTALLFPPIRRFRLSRFRFPFILMISFSFAPSTSPLPARSLGDCFPSLFLLILYCYLSYWTMSSGCQWIARK